MANILPFDGNRVRLTPIRGVEGSDYINASFIDGYRTRQAYIGTQAPMTSTVEDFWRMVWEHKSCIIVMICRLHEAGKVGRGCQLEGTLCDSATTFANFRVWPGCFTHFPPNHFHPLRVSHLQEMCYPYWPTERPARYQFFVIDPVAEYTMAGYILREFKVTDARDGESRTVRQFQFTKWPDQIVPRNGDNFIDLIGQVHKTKDQFGQDGPITVHCRYQLEGRKRVKSGL
ncbi:unnamed protein product [Protopolystoma xenopodis]|uniref:Tyrosine-protein phosphatase domain-containing protein n=1 Tax=Protopolystoma xenopodis TaxID=117903 RepID=A0A3S5AMI2_9PLAT|nr:unnamed protein product [Protopolystoma xenopodis]